MKLARP